MADGASSSPAEAAGAGTLPASQLPWQQIPAFDPATTDLQVYSRKLQFLKEIWPAEHIAQLAPRAALQVQGVAFAKVARLDAGKLRSESGVKYLVEALGGQWGRLASEEKLSYFERAFYLTTQKPDESNDSYLARHDSAFEDMTTAGVTLEEVRAYVLIRQSQLPPEDRKRIVIQTEGNLSYEGARKSLRLLGAKFFHDLQGGVKSNKYRTYDINAMDTPEETAWVATDMDTMDEDAMVQYMHEAGDEDAAFIMDFEETARTRLRERAKFRGFWAPATNQKGKGKKGRGGFGKGAAGGKPKSLAERIATSTCRKCGAVGHWKRECPLGGKGDSKGKSSSPETITLAEALMTEDSMTDIYQNDEMPATLPEDAVDLGQGPSVQESDLHVVPSPSKFLDHSHKCLNMELFQQGVERMDKSPNLFNTAVLSLMSQQFAFHASVEEKVKPQFSKSLTEKLMHCCRKHGYDSSLDISAVNFHRKPDPMSPVGSCKSDAGVFLSSAEESAGEAVVDTGASRSVIGEDRLKGLVQYVVSKTGWAIKRVSSNVQFRFGNSGTLQSQYAICIPRQQKGWIRVEVVPGRTPFLISNTVLKEMGILIVPETNNSVFLIMLK
eukprot:s374_g8.t1